MPKTYQPAGRAKRSVKKAIARAGTSAGEWLVQALKKQGYDPDEWRRRGEQPTKMLERFAQQKRMNLNQFLEWLAGRES